MRPQKHQYPFKLMFLGVPRFKHNYRVSNSYITVCLPVQGDNPRALESALSPIQEDKTWHNFFIPPSLV